MSGGSKFCQTGIWTPLYQGPSFGFVYVTNVSTFSVTVRWRAYTGSLPFYSSGSVTITPGEKKTVFFGLPTPYVQFEVNPNLSCFLFGS